MNIQNRIISLDNLIEDSLLSLSKQIDTKETKSQKQELLKDVTQNINHIEDELKKIVKALKKIGNKNKRRVHQTHINELTERLSNLNTLFNTKSEQVRDFTEQNLTKQESNRQTHLHQMHNKTHDRVLHKFLMQEDQKFKQGVSTAKQIHAKVKGINATLDEVSDLVQLQRIKLHTIGGQIKDSQSIMRRSHKILKSFSMELHKDKLIKVLLGFITIVLILIMVSALSYKMKSAELIGNEINSQSNLRQFADIDEELFWKTVIEEVDPQKENIITDEDLKKKALMPTGAIDLVKLEKLRNEAGIEKEMRDKMMNNIL